jgi:CRP/FNR family cyclic AMP-dependent transcriptional regulator
MKVEGKPPPFDPKIFLARLGAGKTRAELRKGQIVFAQGDPAAAVFYIQKGKIELRVLSRQGKEAILTVLGVDDFFGEGCLAGQPLRMATAVAVTECSIVRLEKSAMIAVLHDEPVFSALFISYLLTRNIRIEEDLVDQLFNSSEKRLARVFFAVGQLRKGGETRGGDPQGQPGNPGRDDRHYPVAGELFHEQIPQTRLHRIQRQPERPQLAAECGPPRLTGKIIPTCHPSSDTAR